MNLLSNLSDIEALEARPYREVVSARTTTELIAQAAAISVAHETIFE